MPVNTDPVAANNNDPIHINNNRGRRGLTIRRPKNNNRNNNRNNNTRNRRRRNNVPNLPNQAAVTPRINNGAVPNFNPGIQYFMVATRNLGSLLWQAGSYGKIVVGPRYKLIPIYVQNLGPTEVLIISVELVSRQNDGTSQFSAKRLQKYDVSSQTSQNIEVRNAAGNVIKPMGTFRISGTDMNKFKFFTGFKKATAYINSLLGVNRPMLQNQ